MRFGYPTSEAARLVGMSGRQLRYLAAHELVVPSVKRAGGRGSGALYAFEDLFELAVIARLRAVAGCDMPLERVSAALRALRRRPEGRGALLVSDGEGCWVEQGPLEETLARCQALAVVSLDAVEAELRLAANRAGLAPAGRELTGAA
jgi:DNA-binding transcriptional MerR regulator